MRWIYFYETIRDLLFVKELSDFGITIGCIKEIVRSVRKLIENETDMGNSISHFYISCVAKNEFNVQVAKNSVPENIRSCNSYFVINYKRILEKLS